MKKNDPIEYVFNIDLLMGWSRMLEVSDVSCHSFKLCISRKGELTPGDLQSNITWSNLY